MSIEFLDYRSVERRQVIELFRSAFGAAEGEAEGESIGNLVERMMSDTDSEDLYGFVAADGATTIGAIFLSRIRFESEMRVFILSPVAVRADHQGQGTGQALINHGLQEISRDGVEYVITYGDPNYYRKVGFQPISPAAIAPPLELSQPHGWLGQSLTDQSIDSIPGQSRCVTALDNPAYW